jgi:hypothetical protein
MLLVLPVTCTGSGCLAFYSKRPVEIVVTEPETGLPVSNIPVSVDYLYMGVLNAPKEANGKTDKNGRVILSLADFDKGIIFLKAGNREFYVWKETVRQGGVLTQGQPAPQTDGKPNVAVKLFPRPY